MNEIDTKQINEKDIETAKKKGSIFGDPEFIVGE